MDRLRLLFSVCPRLKLSAFQSLKEQTQLLPLRVIQQLRKRSPRLKALIPEPTVGSVHQHLIDPLFPDFSTLIENLCSAARYCGSDDASSFGLLNLDEYNDLGLGGYEYDIDDFLGNGNNDSNLKNKRKGGGFLREYWR